MQHVSSSTTLFFKVALSTVWIVFFGAMTFAFWTSDDINVVAGLPLATFRHIFLIFFLLGIIALYLMVMNIKRVDMDDHFFYVTNYLKHVRYPFHQIEKVVQKDFYFFTSVHIHLKQKGQFGDKVVFIASNERFKRFMLNHPEIAKQLEISYDSETAAS